MITAGGELAVLANRAAATGRHLRWEWEKREMWFGRRRLKLKPETERCLLDPYGMFQCCHATPAAPQGCWQGEKGCRVMAKKWGSAYRCYVKLEAKNLAR